MKWYAVLAKAAFSCSLAAAMALARSQDYGQMREALGTPPTAEAADRLYEEWRTRLQNGDPALANEFVEALARPNRERLDRLARSLDLRRLAQSKEGDDPAQARRIAADIKRSPLYQDRGPRQTSNWLERAFDNLGNALQRILEWLIGRGPRSGGEPLGSIGPWLTYLMWGILAAAAVGLLALALRAFGPLRWHRIRRTAVLANDEPERTADEWLARSAELEAQGLFREAVRCLYLACLTRIDEADVARFVRTQTNWEHLRRIEASPRAPVSVDLRPATRAFDHIWYGHRIRGSDDVAYFRKTYEELWSELRARRAA